MVLWKRSGISAWSKPVACICVLTSRQPTFKSPVLVMIFSVLLFQLKSPPVALVSDLANIYVPGLENPMLVERLQSSVQLHLNEYVAAKHPYDQLRFARILLSLPPLRNIKAQVVTQLFFRDMIGNVAMEDLLSQMLQG